MVEPRAVNWRAINKPFTLLLSKKAWEAVQSQFMKNYPVVVVNNITPDGHLLAVEVDPEEKSATRRGSRG